MPSHYQGSPEEISTLSAYIKLTRAVESVNARITQRGVIEGLTLSQFGVLETLYHLGPLPLCDVARKLLKSGGNITLVIDNLEKRGLVERQRSLEDRRVITASLTLSGEALIKKILPLQIAVICEEMSALTQEEQTQLGNLCKKLGTRKTD